MNKLLRKFCDYRGFKLFFFVCKHTPNPPQEGKCCATLLKLGQHDLFTKKYFSGL